MTYRLKFLPTARSEWEKLAPPLRAQFQRCMHLCLFTLGATFLGIGQPRKWRSIVIRKSMRKTFMENANQTLTLKEVAKWRASPPAGKIIASVPSLQRGLVWEVQQIELLWDSIFRGFPIGSIVLSEKIANQGNRSSSHEASVTHHILDGQQRCYAIALGFENPWVSKAEDDAVLWLDINPHDRLKGGSRKYLFRVTTKAHPWGFSHDENSSRLRYKYISEFMEKFGVDALDADGDQQRKRPLPEKAVPHDAGLPIPLGLLLSHFCPATDVIDWGLIAAECEKNIPGNDFAKRIEDFLKSQPDLIIKGVRAALNAQLVALVVPDASDIDDIVQIFKRLNGQGTPIDPEDLAYSMMKTYWPEVEEILRGVPKHVPEARLTRMAVRAALTGNHDIKLHQADVEANRIRSIFHSTANSLDFEKKLIIKEYVGSSTQVGELKRALEWIDGQLLGSRDRDFGLPSYLRSSLAWSSPDIFVWLMVLAKTHEFEQIDDVKAKRILGLALSIHWFGLDKQGAVNYLMEKIDWKNEFPKDISLDGMNKNERARQLIATPLKPSVLEDLLPINNATNDKYLKAWISFWGGVVKYSSVTGEIESEEEIAAKNRNFPFIERLQSNRELLVYVQRHYFLKEFNDFDPSNRLMWKGHNRPWDYDHILASNTLCGSGQSDLCGDYHGACKAWQKSIGNVVAVDFSFNRAAQDDKASDKYESGRAYKLCGNLPEDLSVFDIDLKQTKDKAPSLAYVTAVRDRLVRLYKVWYDNLLIVDLLN